MRELAKRLAEISKKIDYRSLSSKEKAALVTLTYVYLRKYPSVGGIRLVMDLLKHYPDKIRPIYDKLGFREPNYYGLFERLKPFFLQLPFVEKAALAEDGVINLREGDMNG